MILQDLHKLVDFHVISSHFVQDKVIYIIK